MGPLQVGTSMCALSFTSTCPWPIPPLYYGMAWHSMGFKKGTCMCALSFTSTCSMPVLSLSYDMP
eukprot:3884678-Pyramimonas_sp.AAC.1